MESNPIDRKRLVDEFIDEIMNREGNRGKRCVALEIMKKDLPDPPEGMPFDDEDFVWLIGVLRRHYTSHGMVDIIPHPKNRRNSIRCISIK